MLEGVKVDTDLALEVALMKLAVMQRENVFMEAALNSAHQELDRLRTMVPTDEEVKEDAIPSRSR